MKSKYRIVIPGCKRKVAVAELLEDVLEKKWWLCFIKVSPGKCRGRGYGRKVLEEVLRDADREGVTLFLMIHPFGEMTEKQLSAWYRRNGFRWVKKETYQRKPKEWV